MDLSTGDDHYRGNTAAKIEQGVKFDRRLASAELRPRKKRQAQIDGGGVQRINGVVSGFEPEGFAPFVQRACLLDQSLSEVGVDAPVANLIGVGQGVARDQCFESPCDRVFAVVVGGTPRCL